MQEPSSTTWTLVYECNNGHEDHEVVESFEEIGGYAVESAKQCDECEIHGEPYPEYFVLDRIEVDF